MKLLRLGIMLNSSIRARWVEWLFDGIASSEAAKVVCVIRYDISRFGASVPPWRQSSVTSFSQFAYTLYSRFDALLSGRRLPRPNPASLIDVSPFFAGAKVLRASAIPDLDGCHLADSDLANIRSEELDVILTLGPHTWAGEILSATRLGIWSYSWNGHSAECGDAGLFWAVNDARPVTSIELHVLGQSTETSRVIGRLEVPAHARSLHLTRRKAYAAAVSLTLRCLRLFHRFEVEGVPGQAPDTLAKPNAAESLRCGPPTNARLLLFLSRLALRWLRFRWQSRRGEWWFLALRLRPLAFLRDGGEGDRLQGFAPLPAVLGHSYADPFLLEEGGAVHLFFEDIDKSRGKGVISHSELAADGTLSRPMPVLERPYHLSYPFVFRWDGHIYMLPESGHNRTIELYRCQAFPQSWTLERVLLEGWRATDATLHRSDDGRWWMFAAIDELGEGCAALFLFEAATPLGPWYPHPQNPIQTDLRHTRPAGRLFRCEGRLLRPAQDGSLRYGGGLWLMEVLELAEASYRERPFVRLGPEWLGENLCLHHLDATDRFEVIDGMRLKPAETW